MAPVTSSSSAASRLVTSITIAVLVLAALCFALSWLSYPSAQHQLRALGLIRTSEAFTPEFYGGVQAQIRLLSFLLLLVSVALGALRRPISRAVSIVLRDAAREWYGNTARVAARIRAGLREVEPFEAAVLLLVTAVGLANRLFFLSRAIRYDESYSFLNYVSKPLLAALGHYNENNHLFHTLLAHLSISLFGVHLWSLRLPVLICGTLLIPIAFFTARLLYGGNAAMLSAALVATSSILIDYSTNARGYIIVCCCFLLLVAIGQMILHKSEPALFLAFSVVSICGLYTVPIMLLPFATVVFWLHCSVARRGIAHLLHFEKYLAASLILIGLVCAALYTPPVLISGWSTVTRPTRWAISDPAYLLGRAVYEIYQAVKTWIRDVPPPLSFTLVAGFLISLSVNSRRGDRHRALFVSVLASTAALLVLTHLAPFARTWLFALPFYFMGASWGLAAVLEKVLRGKTSARLAATALTTALLGGLTFVNVNSEAILRTQETEGLKDAEKITNLLIERKVPLNRIIVQCAPIIEYYLYVRENRRVKLGLVSPAPGQTETVWVVVNQAWDNMLTIMLHNQALLAQKVVSVARFDDAAVYEVVVRSAASVQK